uniref:Uncharacterized protein n=1 Tax=Arundo donax TaxID=35708 RepID=A0A0A8XYY9_ARUDO
MNPTSDIQKANRCCKIYLKIRILLIKELQKVIAEKKTLNYGNIFVLWTSSTAGPPVSTFVH